MGFSVESYILPVLFVFGLFLILLAVWNIVLHRRLNKFKVRNEELFAGTKGQNLEELLVKNVKDITLLDRDIQELYKISNQINNLAFRGYHKIGLVRFNPFKDVGGDQSFALAILNGKNNGVTLQSLYTREGARVYAKSILGGVAEKYPLTEEEKKAISLAMIPVEKSPKEEL
jgi:hypothetical protein